MRLAEELSPLRIESDPLLAVRMTMEGEWGIMKPTAMESMWQEWLSRCLSPTHSHGHGKSSLIPSPSLSHSLPSS